MGGSQEHVDRFYFAHGKCCAGCDWWQHINSAAGMCQRMPVEVLDECRREGCIPQGDGRRARVDATETVSLETNLSCQFCNHPTPHSCWDAAEAASCGNYANAREAMKKQHGGVVAVEREIKRREQLFKPLTPKQIEKRERAELARLKEKYEK